MNRGGLAESSEMRTVMDGKWKIAAGIEEDQEKGRLISFHTMASESVVGSV